MILPFSFRCLLSENSASLRAEAGVSGSAMDASVVEAKTNGDGPSLHISKVNQPPSYTIMRARTDEPEGGPSGNERTHVVVRNEDIPVQRPQSMQNDSSLSDLGDGEGSAQLADDVRARCTHAASVRRVSGARS